MNSFFIFLALLVKVTCSPNRDLPDDMNLDEESHYDQYIEEPVDFDGWDSFSLSAYNDEVAIPCLPNILSDDQQNQQPQTTTTTTTTGSQHEPIYIYSEEEMYDDEDEEEEEEYNDGITYHGCLGVGTDGIVHSVCQTRNGHRECWAEKRVSLAMIARNDPRSLYKEISVMAKLRGDPRFTQIYSFTVEDNTAMINMELINGKSLEMVMHAFPNGLPFEIVRQIAFQLLQAISHLDDLGIVHCDISPRNIMLQPDGNIKLIDFGRAVKSGRKQYICDTEPLVTWAPEVRTTHVMTSKSDVWSWGVTVHYLLTGKYPFDLSDINSKHLLAKRPSDLRQVPMCLLVATALLENVQVRPEAKRLLTYAAIQPTPLDDEQFAPIKEFLLADIPRVRADTIFRYHEKAKMYEAEADPQVVSRIKARLDELRVKYRLG